MLVAAPRTERLTLILFKAHGNELGECLVVREAMDALGAERPRLCREKKMLRLNLRCESCSGERMQIFMELQQLYFVRLVLAEFRIRQMNRFRFLLDYLFVDNSFSRITRHSLA